MPWITVAIPPFGSIEQFDRVMTQVEREPAGLEARYVGTAADGSLRVVTLWESKAHADRRGPQLRPPARRLSGGGGHAQVRSSCA